MNNATAISLLNASADGIPLVDGTAHCVVTSPPYWSLRKYQGQQERDWPAVSYAPMPGLPPVEVPAMRCALGLEPDPVSYVAHLILCFRECYRVLRDDGVMWAVMGDSYCAYWSGKTKSPLAQYTEKCGAGQERPNKVGFPEIKQGSLMFIPHRLALALQADGWLVRNDPIWHKLAPMPESVAGTRWERHKVKVRNLRKRSTNWAMKSGNTSGDAGPGLAYNPWAEYTDCPGCPSCEPNGGYVLRRGSWRHTRAHETVIMCVKSMGYWANQEAVRETLALESIGRAERYQNAMVKYDSPEHPDSKHCTGGIDQSHAYAGLASGRSPNAYNPAGCNPRSVLTPKPESYSGPHYAVFPKSLVMPLIRATCPTRCCPTCGAGWAPVIKYEPKTLPVSERHGRTGHVGQPPQQSGWFWTPPENHVLGLRPTCTCHGDAPDLPYVPGLVLDPFAGTGTTLLVAKELGLRAVGLDISGEYLRDQAAVRVLKRTPAGALAGLPLFGKTAL